MNSFIVPAHNEEALVGQTVRAIRDAAESVGQPYEVIVVDDASTDATAEIARQQNAVVVAVNHRQIAATRNAGARAARGERLFFVDADTTLSPRVLSAAIRALDKGAVGGGALARLDGPVPLYARLFALWIIVMMRIANLSGGAFLFCTREAFQAVGGFDERLFGAEDAALSSALAREGRFVVLWTRVLTSGRRVRTTSGLRMLGFVVAVAISPSKVLKQRSRVEKMWYDSNRENDERPPSSLVVYASNFVALLIMTMIIGGPLWAIPLPESLRDGPLGTIKYGIQVFLCHVGLIVWPCAYFLVRALLRQKRWIERIKLLVLIAVCLWIGWNNTREVFWFWMGVFQ